MVFKQKRYDFKLADRLQARISAVQKRPGKEMMFLRGSISSPIGEMCRMCIWSRWVLRPAQLQTQAYSVRILFKARLNFNL
jgi:hypothetical protein